MTHPIASENHARQQKEEAARAAAEAADRAEKERADEQAFWDGAVLALLAGQRDCRVEFQAAIMRDLDSRAHA